MASYLTTYGEYGYFPSYYTGTSSTSVTPIWNAWTTSTASTTTGTVWGNWTSTAATTTMPQIIWNQWQNQWTRQLYEAPPKLTEEQEAAQRVARAQAEEAAAKRRADAAEAVQRAETLLHENLRPGQRRMLRERRRFYVRSQHGRRYEIERGHHANVWEVDGKGKRLSRLCVYAIGGVPEGDQMLAQKLHIENNEENFRRTAHITPL